MAIPSQPSNVTVQQANSQVYLMWDLVAGSTSYSINRSTDGVTYSVVGTPSVNNFLDTTVVVNTLYYYQVASTNGSGTSGYTSAQQIIPTLNAKMSLAQMRLSSLQRADRVGTDFVTVPEVNSYISQSLFELYDLLITLYEDYYVQTPYVFLTDGSSQQYTLPADFYKLLGVDCGLGASANAWTTIKKFDFIARNRYIYPNITSTFLGVFNMQYRLVGNTLMFIPTPSGGQQIRVWYIPKITQPLQDTDVIDGISGWTEYIITDVAIKILQKEESDVQVFEVQKQQLLKRIEDSAMNRDAGQPDTISDTRNWGRGQSAGGPGSDGSSGGW